MDHSVNDPEQPQAHRLISISRHYYAGSSVDTVEYAALLHQDRIFGWYIDPLRTLQRAAGACGYPIMTMCCPMIECHGILISGERTGKAEDFYRGMRDVFSTMFVETYGEPKEEPTITHQDVLEAIYGQVRCALLHEGRSRNNVILSNCPHPMIIASNENAVSQIQINPDLFLDQLEVHFSHYISALFDENNSELRDNFKRGWAAIHSS